MAIIGGAIGLTALISGGITYLFTKSSNSADNESIKGQITVVNEAHNEKNQTQDIMIITSIVLLVIIMIAFALKFFAHHISKRTERRINNRDLELNNV